MPCCLGPTLLPIVDAGQPTDIRRPHLGPLDGLRGFAAGLVLLFHAQLFGFTLPVIAYGSLGVDLFFVLSGFLLVMPWLRAQAQGRRYAWQTYVRRRLSRIVPAYYVCIAVLAIWPAPLPFGNVVPPRTAEYLLAHLAFVANAAAIPNLNGVFWSLSTEMHFYVLLPVLAMGFSRQLWPVSLVAGVSLACWWRVTVGDVGYLNTVLLPARLDAFAVGMAAAALYLRLEGTHRPWQAWACTIAGLGLLAPLFWLGSAVLGHVLSPSVAAVGFGFLLLGAVLAPTAVSGVWSALPLRRLGTVAYSLYLWHLPIIMIGVTASVGLVGIQRIVAVAMTLLAALAAATLGYWLTERPFLDGGRACVDLVRGLANWKRRIPVLGWSTRF